MTHSLRELDAHLRKTVTVISEEIETDPAEGDCVGKYVWRDVDGKKYKWGPTPQSYEFHNVDTVAEADCISFLCPVCFDKNGGPVGTHGVHVTFANRNVPDEASSHDADGKPSRWNASGNTVDDLVLTPSILLDAKRDPKQGCHWHGFVGSSNIPPGHAG